MLFLKKSEVRKRIANQVMLLPGRSSVYEKTSQLIPPYQRSTDSSFFGKKEVELEQLAFNSVS